MGISVRKFERVNIPGKLPKEDLSDRNTENNGIGNENVKSIGFTATHGLKHANRGPFFLWLDGKCSNALTVNSWWHQNFILEYADYEEEKESHC